jgi:hypothetical protein
MKAAGVSSPDICAPLLTSQDSQVVKTQFKKVVNSSIIYVKYEMCSISKFPKVIKIKREVVTTLVVAHLFRWRIINFQHNPRAHGCICPILARLQKFRRVRNRTVAFTTNLQQPFPPYYYGIGDLPGVNKHKTGGARSGL